MRCTQARMQRLQGGAIFRADPQACSRLAHAVQIASDAVRQPRRSLAHLEFPLCFILGTEGRSAGRETGMRSLALLEAIVRYGGGTDGQGHQAEQAARARSPRR